MYNFSKGSANTITIRANKSFTDPELEKVNSENSAELKKFWFSVNFFRFLAIFSLPVCEDYK